MFSKTLVGVWNIISKNHLIYILSRFKTTWYLLIWWLYNMKDFKNDKEKNVGKIE